MKSRFFVALLLRMTVGCVCACVCAAFAQAQEARLVLNEAMANEPGSATSLEWVELVNWPDSGDGVINLSGYWFVDGNDTTAFDTNLTIAPGGFVILARKVVGESSFEQHWGDGSGVWGDADDELSPVIAAEMVLRNSADTVTLYAPTGDTSAMLWHKSSEDGVSLERMRPDSHDGVLYAAACLDPSKSTPGRPNSVLPGENDIAIDSILVSSATPPWGSPIQFAVYLTNVGFGPAANFAVDINEDLNPPTQTVFEQVTGFIRAPWAPIAEGRSEVVTLPWNDAPPGRHHLFTQTHNDPNPSNDQWVGIVTVLHTQPLVIVSEYMANPQSDQGEWVEISNQAGFPIDLTSTRIGDAEESSTLPGRVGFIQPGGFWVLVQDETAFRSFYPMFSGLIMEIPSWKPLNNGGDQIRLLGAGGEIIDSLTYSELYDDNRSVERLNLSPTFASPGDWTGSVDPSGATPGEANSVSRETAGSFTVSVSPNPIYLSAGDEAVIEYRMEIGESLTLKLYDRSGRLVRTIADETPAATGTVMWDGTDDGGARVPPGPYVLLARSDPAGAVEKRVVVVGP